MNNPELKTLFATALAIDIENVTPKLAYGTIAEWDSTAHMILITEIENQYDIMLDTDDIIDMSSVFWFFIHSGKQRPFVFSEDKFNWVGRNIIGRELLK